MTKDPAQLRPKFNLTWSQARQWIFALPFRGQLVLGVFLIAALLLALHTAFSGKDSSLHLRLQHGFRSAQFTVFVDGQRQYSGKLVGYPKKKYGLFGETVEGSLSEAIAVRSGRHEIRVRVEPGDGTIQEETITGVFGSGVGRELSVAARRNGLSLSWRGLPEGAGTDSASEATTPSWFSKYAGSLFLTIAGSIASALTGFAIRELPGYLKTRQEHASKAPSGD